jgi:hypothetical protein
VENKAGVNVEYLPCAQLLTICSIALTDLISNYLLLEGDDIKVQVSATNMYGVSTLSQVANSQKVQVVPHKPSQLIARGSLTTQSQIHVKIPALLNSETGGASIVSYIVSWDQGLGGAFSDLSGTPLNDLSLSQIYTVGVSSGVSYQFVYRALNAQGEGPQSDAVSILAATVPTAMAAPAVTFSGDY